MTDIVIPLFVGFGFGFALQKAGLTYYQNIVNVFRFTNLTVLKFMMTALAVAMIGTFGLHAAGLIALPTISATYIVGNLAGGLIFGIGMAAAGFWPGTCAAGSGQGNLDYLIPGLLGFTTGALIYGATYQGVFPTISAIANVGSVTLPEVFNIDLWLTVTLFVLIAVTLFYFLERHGELRKDKVTTD